VRQPRVSIAAVLFTDLVESTALRTRLGEDAADALQHHHDRLLADAIARHAGSVVKATPAGGAVAGVCRLDSETLPCAGPTLSPYAGSLPAAS